MPPTGDTLCLDHILPQIRYLEEYLYRRAIEIIEPTEPDSDKENLLFQEVWYPLADLYKDRITASISEC